MQPRPAGPRGASSDAVPFNAEIAEDRKGPQREEEEEEEEEDPEGIRPENVQRSTFNVQRSTFNHWPEGGNTQGR